MVVTQQADKAILNWRSFNVGEGNSLQFVQPSAGSEVLNRIHGSDPSVIAGKLSANGQVYLINQNGIVFKGGAQVNVGSLVASTLDIADEVFRKGLGSVSGKQPTFEGVGAGNISLDRVETINDKGEKVVQTPHLQTGPGGRVVLIAPNVTNEGLIETPDGQTILAAGAKAYFESGATTDPKTSIHGFVVQVDGGGKALNLGDILVGKGDAELVGLAVQQFGRISARSSVSQNGTIRLLAQDTVRDVANGNALHSLLATRGGLLELGENSVTQLSSDDATTTVETAFKEQDFLGSRIELQGQSIELKPGGKLVANPGRLEIRPALDPSTPTEAEINVKKTLPYPCYGVCGTNKNAGWRYSSNGTPKLSVTQQGEKAILNWQSFNIARGYSVPFNQPSASSEILNRVRGVDPSVVAGKMSSNGQVYLINHNGIVFNRASQINVGGLVATTLDIADPVYQAGYPVLDSNQAVFQSEGGKDLIVEKGASLRTAQGGRAVLIASNVLNEGLIETPDGQTILAAGAKAYVGNGLEKGIAGYLVEVDDGGNVTNRGDILVGQGDAELVGRMVQQDGRISALSSVRAHGSIRLLAQDTAVNEPGRSAASKLFTPVGSVGGYLVLGENSVTEVLPDLNDPALSVDEQVVSPSRIELHGKSVDLMPNSKVVAPGGIVDVLAAINPSQPGEFGLPEKDTALKKEGLIGIHVGSNALIDVSGTRGAVLPMSRNLASVELRGIQLADSPLQRDGVLQGQNVTFDIRMVDASGNIPLADVSSPVKGIGRSVQERFAVGGTIQFNSHGEILAAPGSRLDVSGGQIRYEGGTITTTKLVAGGRVYDISAAPADVIYDGILGHQAGSSGKWGVDPGSAENLGRYEPGYVEGKGAGEIKLAAPFVTLNGDISGARVVGPFQVEAAKQPAGGRLTIGWLGYIPEEGTYRNFVTNSFELRVGTEASGEANRLDIDKLGHGGFSHLSVFSNGSVSLAAGAALALPAGGSLTVEANQVDIGADISAPGGIVDIRTRDTGARDLGTIPQTVGKDVSIAPGVRVSTAGQWTNDSLFLGNTPSPAVALDGGRISLVAREDLLLPAGTVLDVDGGAWLRADGSLRLGRGGSMELGTQFLESRLELDGSLSGFGFGAGGSLKLTAAQIQIANQPVGASTQLGWTPSFFGANGFSKLVLSANAGDLTIGDGVTIAPKLRTRVVAQDFRRLQSGASLDRVGVLTVLPDDLRAPINLSFETNAGAKANLTEANFGRVTLAETAKIIGDPGAAIQLSSKFQLAVLGEIRAPAGSISLNVDAVPSSQHRGKYYAQQGLWIGPKAVLAANGVERLRRSGANTVRVVEDAGSVSLLANAGYLVMDSGAVVDISAAQGVADFVMRPGTLPEAVATIGRAGRMEIRATEALFLSGSVNARSATPTTPGGELTVTFGRTPAGYTTFYQHNNEVNLPKEPRRLLLQQGADVTPTSIAPLSELPAALNGLGAIDVSWLKSAGFDSVKLKSDHEIRVGTNLDLAIPGSLVLDAPFLTQAPGVATISANYLGLGNYEEDAKWQRDLAPPRAALGESNLTLHAQWVDLVGNLVVDGVGKLTIKSDRDLRLRGLLDITGATPRIVGGMRTAGDLYVEASRVYPVTLSEFTIEAVGPATRTIRIEGDGSANAGELLSAGGILHIKAPVIEQFGDLRAPFGAINLEASSSLELGPKSNTSVTADAATVPFGNIFGGQEWLYGLVQPLGTGESAILSELPEKRVDLTAPKMAIQAGAVIDISGGGDLSAYEFQKGVGGSKDVLSDANTYAILPALGNTIAPFDRQHNSDALYSPTRMVALSGVPGLADGSYTLLPAHYALLPGAFMVRKVGSQPGLQPGARVSQTDGSVLVAGYSGPSGSLFLDAKPVTFRVTPGAFARQQSFFLEKRANEFFAASPQTGGGVLPGDAGTLSISAIKSLRMDGIVRGLADYKYQGARVDITGPAIRIAAPGVTVDSDSTLVLDAQTIGRFGAADILLGGIRHNGPSSVVVDVSARSVVVDPNVVLEGQTVTLAADEEVRVGHGAQIRSVGASTGRALQSWVIGKAEQAGSGEGVLLQVSGEANVELQRTAVARKNGVLTLEAGSVIAGPSIVMDTTGLMTVDGKVDPTSALDIGLARLVLGDAPSQAEGTRLPLELTKKWDALDQIRLRSYGGTDFFGNTSLGSSSLKRLILETLALRAAGDVPDQAVRVAATEIILRSVPGQLTDSPLSGSRTLTLSANSLKLGKGDTLFEGFSVVNFDVGTEVVAIENGSLQAQGSILISAPLLTSATKIDYAVKSNGKLEFVSNGRTAVRPDGLAGTLRLNGASAHIDSTIDLPSGEVWIAASGPDGLTVGSQGVISTAGRYVPLLDYAGIETPGGVVTLRSDSGALNVNGLVDVSAGGEGADVGSVSLSAPLGSIEVLGVMKAGGSSLNGGRASLDAKNIVRIDKLAQTLSQVGFHAAQSYRVRDGNIILGAGVQIAAGEVSFAADNGGIVLEGGIAAVRPNGGMVRLVANSDITVKESGRISATATSSGKAGVVELESVTKSIQIKSGARINAGSAASGGVVRLISTYVSGSPIRVGRLPVDAFTNVGDLLVVGLVDESAKVVSGNIDAAVLTKIKSDMDKFASSLTSAHQSLGTDGLPKLRVVPGVRIDVPGDLNLATDWDFAKWRSGDVESGAEAGVLVLRAGGNLTINGSLSDGFDVTTANKTATLKLGPSWSYRIVAGADRAAADVFAVSSASSGSISVASEKWIRTGRGDIRLFAARDIELKGQTIGSGSEASIKAGTGAVIYTAGVPAGILEKFTTPKDVFFPVQGGRIELYAGRNVLSVPTKQLYTAWMPRLAFDPNGASWGINFSQFKQGVAALGGGDIVVVAGGNVENLSASVPTLGRSVPASRIYELLNSGDVTVRAGGDVLSSLFYVGRGALVVRASGSIATKNPGSLTTPADSSRFTALYAVGEGSVSVQARGDVNFDSVINPTLLGQGSVAGATRDRTFFSTYSQDSSVKVLSITGNVIAQQPSPLLYYENGLSRTDYELPIYPSKLQILAPIGDIRVLQPIVLYPSKNGQLELLAGHDISAGNVVTGTLIMSGADPELLPSQKSPTNWASIKTRLWDPITDIYADNSEPLHTGDALPVRLVALNDVGGAVSVPKSLRVTAGRDIVNLNAVVQNISERDVTEFNAGRDLSFPITRNASTGQILPNNNGFVVNGPGKLFVFSGRDVRLGTSNGIVANGNEANPRLSEKGADIFVYAGIDADYVDWLQQNIQPLTDVEKDNYSPAVKKLVQFVSERLGREPTDAVEAWSEFMAMPSIVQRPLVLEFIAARELGNQGENLPLAERLHTSAVELENALRAAGIAHNTVEGGTYDLGWAAIAKVFPGKSYKGDLINFYSQIKTADGGDVRVFVPGGQVDVGVNKVPVKDKDSADKGILALKEGAVIIFARGDVMVNESRVFTLKGGNILIWSSVGSVDAGRGAKTAITTPAPKLVYDLATSQFKRDYNDSVVGSGIRSIVTDRAIKAGDVDLMAPAGTVNAGDAGIGSAGGLRVAALAVKGADNIQVSGTSSGIPSTETSSLSIGLAGQADASSNAAKGVQESLAESAGENSATPQADRALAYLEVMIQGFGGDEETDSKKD